MDKYYKNEDFMGKSGPSGTFVKIKGVETKPTKDEGPLVGYIFNEGQEITKEEYNQTDKAE